MQFWIRVVNIFMRSTKLHFMLNFKHLHWYYFIWFFLQILTTGLGFLKPSNHSLKKYVICYCLYYPTWSLLRRLTMNCIHFLRLVLLKRIYRYNVRLKTTISRYIHSTKDWLPILRYSEAFTRYLGSWIMNLR